MSFHRFSNLRQTFVFLTNSHGFRRGRPLPYLCFLSSVVPVTYWLSWMNL
ncbi:hypothetical protein Hanom_Chr16g01471261 [Helianthus anomalus]